MKLKCIKDKCKYCTEHMFMCSARECRFMRVGFSKDAEINCVINKEIKDTKEKLQELLEYKKYIRKNQQHKNNNFLLVKKFMKEVNNFYPELVIKCRYNPGNNEYEIRHNNAQLEFQDSIFNSIIANLAQRILFDNNIYNFSFGYEQT